MYRFIVGGMAMPVAKKAKKAGKKSFAAKAKDFGAVFTALREILDVHTDQLAVRADKPGYYCLEAPWAIYKGKPLFFAGVRTGKNYVSFHLMPVYGVPDLLQGMSPVLEKRMQGKACFNFTAVDPACFRELSRLTAAGLRIFKSEKFLRIIE
jgi:hypothetical protein